MNLSLSLSLSLNTLHETSIIVVTSSNSLGKRKNAPYDFQRNLDMAILCSFVHHF
jgi:hypothetical protein